MLRKLEHFAKRSKHFATFFEKIVFTLFYVECGSIPHGTSDMWPVVSAIFWSNAPVLLWHMHIFEKYISLRRFALVFALGYGFWKDWEILPPGNPRRLARFRVFLHAIQGDFFGFRVSPKI